jgi:hydrogenase maturation protein HypF
VIACRLLVTGKVQGVGFRPFVYRLACRHGLTGWVQNRTGNVEIHLEGPRDAIDKFCTQLAEKAPPIAEPSVQSITEVTTENTGDFVILKSETDNEADIHIPNDFYTCSDCLAEMRDPGERRYRYPFINCTQCGPRYTIIKALPYDRQATSMANFPLCADCSKEFEDPSDRRFHAQPLACPACGPSLAFSENGKSLTGNAKALAAAVEAIKNGKVVAIKGIGGYHLVCSALDSRAIAHLRKHKPRPDKPLALMCPERGENGLAMVGRYVELSAEETELLRSPGRPIVIARRKADGLAASIAPGLKQLGIMLPYSPLHYLLLDALEFPIVATSANISGEPVLTDNHEVETRLSHVAQGFLHHNRDIVRPADDPVYRTIGGQPRPLRLGRGNAPLEISLPFRVPEPVIAAGSHMKNTVALAWEDRLVVSPHIGDLDSPRSREVFEQVIADLQDLYQAVAKTVICDAHPGYASTRWAENSGLPVHKVFHHEAHASALVLEHWADDEWLIFTWDGVGYGRDGSLWGGEGLHGTPGNWKRVTSLVPFHLPGGEKAGREPWRSAAALCWQAGIDCPVIPDNSEILKTAWERRMNAPRSTAAGRLFDAAAALTGLLQTASYEGQGPILLEHASAQLSAADPLPLIADEDGILRADWSGLLAGLLDTHTPIAERAAEFHARLAHTLLAKVLRINETLPVRRIGLCGGVFQNRKLVDYTVDLLAENGFAVYLPQRLPANDAAISSGQLVDYACSIYE